MFPELSRTMRCPPLLIASLLLFVLIRTSALQFDFSKSVPAIAWSLDTSAVVNSSVVTVGPDDELYVLSTPNILQSIDYSGRIVWQKKLESPCIGAPLILVHHASNTSQILLRCGDVISLNADTGKILWRSSLTLSTQVCKAPSSLGITQHNGLYATEDAETLLVFGSYTNGTGCSLALSANTGELVAMATLGSHKFEPYKLAFAGKTAFVLGFEELEQGELAWHIFALHTDNLLVFWHTQFSDPVPKDPAAGFLALEFNVTFTKVLALIVSFPHGNTFAIDQSTGQQLWRLQHGKASDLVARATTQLLFHIKEHPETVIVGLDHSKLVLIDARTGFIVKEQTIYDNRYPGDRGALFTTDHSKGIILSINTDTNLVWANQLYKQGLFWKMRPLWRYVPYAQYASNSSTLSSTGGRGVQLLLGKRRVYISQAVQENGVEAGRIIAMASDVPDCHLHTSCYDCNAHSTVCGWCATSSRCLALVPNEDVNQVNTAAENEACPDLYTGVCPPDNVTCFKTEMQKTCAKCLSDTRCQYHAAVQVCNLKENIPDSIVHQPYGILNCQADDSRVVDPSGGDDQTNQILVIAGICVGVGLVSGLACFGGLMYLKKRRRSNYVAVE
eukprot:Colp12_sorted_trinity150504_noHs@9075